MPGAAEQMQISSLYAQQQQQGKTRQRHTLKVERLISYGARVIEIPCVNRRVAQLRWVWSTQVKFSGIGKFHFHAAGRKVAARLVAGMPNRIAVTFE